MSKALLLALTRHVTFPITMNNDVRYKLEVPLRRVGKSELRLERIRSMVREGRDLNVPISEADLVFVDYGGEVSERSCGKESEVDEDGDAGRMPAQGGEPAQAGRRRMRGGSVSSGGGACSTWERED